MLLLINFEISRVFSFQLFFFSCFFASMPFCGGSGIIFCSLLLLFSHLVVSDSLQPHGLQHSRLPCPSLPPRVCSNSCPLSRWCYLTISSSVTPFSFWLQSFPASGSFPMSQLFASGGQNTGASASVLLINFLGWFPVGLTGLISLQPKGSMKGLCSVSWVNILVHKLCLFCYSG